MTKKFNEFEYVRPDLISFEKNVREEIENFKASESAKEQMSVYKSIVQLLEGFNSMRSISNIRYTIDTKDKFYSDEHDFFDHCRPLIMDLSTSLYEALINSKFRKEIEEEFGKHLFDNAEITLKTFNNDIADDLRKESNLINSYVKMIASAKIPFEGEDRNIPSMDPFMQSTDREVRKNANEAKWKFFEENESEFDRIYDELVKVRTQMAKKLGYKNFIQLGYDKMHRLGYGPEEVKRFRENVKEHIVPVVAELHEMRKDRLGIGNLYYYDAAFDFANGNPVPKGDPEWIVENAMTMYQELSKETSEFMKFMIEGSLMDLYNRKGKSAGGYCSFIPDYKSPFIFANMNGTSHDIRVLTHEAGHAFQAYVCRNFELPEYRHATSETCEVHSMGMEFLTWPWMKLFFKEDNDKFLFHHLARAIKFIPYGVSIDEFQHFVYENPDASPEERKSKWREIERTYTPTIDYADNDFLNRGGFWFHQQHVFRMPFYYIDYCLAQVCALQIWRNSNHDRKKAWNDYLNLCKQGGSKPFLELLKIAGLSSPFEASTLESIVSYAEGWIDEVEKTVDSKLLN
ncbi:MAG: M3 family oligoendopeptidase [Ignavibacteria bacterium]|jgi:M3 family oligoendopeptidase